MDAGRRKCNGSPDVRPRLVTEVPARVPLSGISRLWEVRSMHALYKGWL